MCVPVSVVSAGSGTAERASWWMLDVRQGLLGIDVSGAVLGILGPLSLLVTAYRMSLIVAMTGLFGLGLGRLA